ncbi:MAG: hypothetical protein ACFFD4_00165 [Candidatus Odinarchaeota archaeon]
MDNRYAQNKREKMINHPPFFQSCLIAVTRVLEEHEAGKAVDTKTGPTYKHRGNSHVLSWNFFFKETQGRSKFWEAMVDELENKVLPPVTCSSEVIKHHGCQGTITDSGQRAFEVIRSVIYEVYLYKEETFVYLRMLEERDLSTGKQWISLDVDLIENTPWFLD